LTYKKIKVKKQEGNKFNSPTQNSYTGTFEMPIKKNNTGVGSSVNYSDFSWRYFYTANIYEESKQIKVKAFLDQ